MRTICFVLFSSIATIWSAQNKPDLEVRSDTVEIRYKEKPVLVYTFNENQFKPYVRELYTLGGENVLRDSPPDHVHHHGLMFAIRVNDTNFWEEKIPNPGIQKPIRILRKDTGQTREGLPRASFTHLIHWVAATNRHAANSKAAALLIEERMIEVVINEKANEVAATWKADFQVGPNAGKVRLGGAHYHGLGLRLPESFNHAARFENSGKKPYTAQNTQNVVPAEWTTVTGKLAEGEATIALYDHPDNRQFATGFFSMLDPFAYLSVTQGLDKAPLEYSAGDKFRLRYLLTVSSGTKPESLIAERYRTWRSTGQAGSVLGVRP